MRKMALVLSVMVTSALAYADELENKNKNTRTPNLPAAMVIRVSDKDSQDVQVMYSDEVLDPKTAPATVADGVFHAAKNKQPVAKTDKSIVDIAELDKDSNVIDSWYYMYWGYPSYGYGYGYPNYGYYPTYYYNNYYYGYYPYYGYGYGGYNYSWYRPYYYW